MGEYDGSGVRRFRIQFSMFFLKKKVTYWDPLQCKFDTKIFVESAIDIFNK